MHRGSNLMFASRLRDAAQLHEAVALASAAVLELRPGMEGSAGRLPIGTNAAWHRVGGASSLLVTRSFPRAFIAPSTERSRPGRASPAADMKIKLLSGAVDVAMQKRRNRLLKSVCLMGVQPSREPILEKKQRPSI